MADIALAQDEMILEEHLPFTLDGGVAERARIGIIVLATDYTMEREWMNLMDIPGVAVYAARIKNDPQITPETLRAMEPRLTDTADLILPGADLDVLAFGCTSASMAIGEARVFELLEASKPGAKYTTPITSAFAAFRAFGAKRVGVLTPYRADVNRIVADYMTTHGGVEVPVFGSFNEEMDDRVARIDPASIKTGIERLKGLADIDAVFVSCTSVRLANVAADLERDIGLPITSSNHAMAWHALRLGGVTDERAEFGSLFTKQLAEV
ncbi:MAG: Asp/Glu racemase [Alphaproteobacteria bacterium]|nr:Asp/Glu racemase [Alphaproteobacteria bacterium]